MSITESTPYRIVITLISFINTLDQFHNNHFYLKQSWTWDIKNLLIKLSKKYN